MKCLKGEYLITCITHAENWQALHMALATYPHLYNRGVPQEHVGGRMCVTAKQKD